MPWLLVVEALCGIMSLGGRGGLFVRLLVFLQGLLKERPSILSKKSGYLVSLDLEAIASNLFCVRSVLCTIDK